MELLCTLRESEIYPGSVDADSTEFSERKAARAVVFNDMGQVALLKVGNKGYHKLPGGGIEGGEDATRALERELLEELGAEAEVRKDIGQIIEYRDQHQLRQISYCFMAKQIGELQPPAYTDEELADGFSIIWSSNLDEAITLIEQDTPSDYSGHFIVARDLILLKAAKELVTEIN